MGYPTAYRSGARKYGNGGFQNPLTVPPGKKPPRPANDNWPKPANDNDPGAGAIKLPEFPAFPGLPAEDLAMRYAVKLIPPPLRTAINFYDVISTYWPNMRKEPIFELPGWIQGCGPNYPGGLYDAQFAWHKTGTATLCGLANQALVRPADRRLPALIGTSRHLRRLAILYHLIRIPYVGLSYRSTASRQVPDSRMCVILLSGWTRLLCRNTFRLRWPIHCPRRCLHRVEMRCQLRVRCPRSCLASIRGIAFIRM